MALHVVRALLFTILALAPPPTHCAIRRFTFDVKYTSAAPDGVMKGDNVLTINGLFPGPKIIATEGDTVVVDVINNIQDGQNTSIHWHGVHQRGTPWEDGTTMIAQCPVRAGDHQVYEFPVPISGTYWYHAHMKSQYVEGLWGPLIVHKAPGRQLYDYDDELIISITDWYHRPVEELEMWHLSKISKGAPPFPDSALMNGRGRTNCSLIRDTFNCEPRLQKRPVFKVQPGKTYRIRVINTSGYSGFRFSIDGHKMHAIEVDAVDVVKTPGLDVAVIASAQRYSFLVTMNASAGAGGGRFLIRADLMSEVLFLDGDNINTHPGGIMPNATGVLEYARVGEPMDRGHDYGVEPYDHTQPLPVSGFSQMANPLFLDDNLLHAYDGKKAPGTFDQEYVLNVTFVSDENGVRRGSLNNVSFRLPTDKPLLFKMIDGDPIPEYNNPLYLRYGDVIQVVINNPFDGRHPFHFHGHSFWVMGTGNEGDGYYDPCKHTLVFDGIRRDTVVVHEKSWVVIRFVAENPGLWALHCHIDWHNLSGMAAVFVEAPEMAHQLRIPEESKRVCAGHGISLRANQTVAVAGVGGGGLIAVAIGTTPAPLRRSYADIVAGRG